MLEDATALRRPRPGGALFVALLMLALTVLTSVVVPAPRAQAAPRDPMESHALATYNTQGSKWDTDVPRVMQNENGTVRNDIVFIQESGGVPEGWPATGRFEEVSRNGRTFRVTEYRWGNLWVYHLPPSGAGNNRTSMAIVTRQRATEFTVLPNNAGAGPRGSIGVLFGDTWYYNIHANAGDALGDSLAARTSRNATAMADANAFVREVARRSRTQGHHWFVGGDFNINLQDEEALRALRAGGGYEPPTGYLYRPRRPTHQSGGELDFGVGSRRVDGYGARVPRGQGSDHYETEFRPNLVASGREPEHRANLNDPNGDLNVDDFLGRTGQEPGLNNAYAGYSNTHQNWSVIPIPWEVGPVMFKNEFSGKCLAFAPNPVTGNPRLGPIVNETCDPHNVREHFTARTSNPDEWLTYNNSHIAVAAQTALQPLLASPWGPSLPLNEK